MPLLIAVVLLGWLVGGFANWAADVLPIPDPHSLPPPAARAAAAWHYLTLPWYFGRPGHVCPHCGQARPWRAPALELGMVAVFLAAWWRFAGEPLLLAILWLYVAFLLTVLVIDYEHHLVLNVMLWPAALAALAASLLSMAVRLPFVPAPLSALFGGLVGLVLFLLLAVLSRGTLGAGDVKLAGVIGLMVGFPLALNALFSGVVLAGLAALILVVTRRATRKSYMAYAPYLCLGALAVLFRIL